MLGSKSSRHAPRSPPRRADVEAPQPRTAALARLDDARPAAAAEGEPRAASAGAGILRRPLAGALGYALHSVTFLALAIFALVYFGQLFWLVAAVSAGLGALSLYHGYAALRAPEYAHSERRP